MRSLTIILTFFLASCCCKFNDNDFAFTELHENLLKPYVIGDTIYFLSQTGDLDTIIISNIDTLQQCGCFMENNRRHVSIEIKHLPQNNWIFGTESNPDGSVNVLDQDVILIEKSLSEELPQYFIMFNYRTFRGEFPGFDSIYTDDKFIDLGISKYWTIINSASEWKQNKEDSTTILKVYWTEKYGLTSYELINGEIYRIKKNRP